MMRIRHGGAVAAAAAASLCLLGSAGASTQSLTCGQVVTTSVTLSANLNCASFSDAYILQVDAADVTINLNGFAIIGPASGSFPRRNFSVVLDMAGGMTLENGRIIATNASNGVVLDDRVSGSSVANISFSLGGTGTEVAVSAGNGDHNTFSGLSGTNLRSLVQIASENHDIVWGNTSHGAKEAFVDEHGSNDTFQGNKAYADATNSYYCHACSDETFSGNYAESAFDVNGAFEDLDPAGPQTFTGNTVAASGSAGFNLFAGTSPETYTVTGNVVKEASGYGIRLWASDGSTVTGNTVSGVGTVGFSIDPNDGIYVVNPVNTTIANNKAIANDNGFVIAGSGLTSMTFTGNTANNNLVYGFRFEQDDNNAATPTLNHDTAIGNAGNAFSLAVEGIGTAPWSGDALIGRNTGGGADCVYVTCSPPSPPAAGVPGAGGSTVEGQFLTGTKGAWGISTVSQSFSYLWLRCDSGGSNCTPTSNTTLKYKLVHTDIGSTFEFQVTANDDNGQTVATSPASPLVTGLPPTNKTLPVINVLTPQKTLNGTTGTWSATDTITYAKQWLRCDSSGDNCNPIGGATGNQYSIVGADVANTIRLQVTATANAAPAVATSNPTAVIQGIAPSNTSPPTISGNTAEGRPITSTNGTWTGTQPVTVTKQWQRCDTDGNNCANIAGATGSTYTPTADDVGHELMLSYTGSNATAAFGSYAGPTGVIQVYAPSNTTQPTISGTLRDGATLTAHSGTWGGGSPATSITYQWFRCDSSGDLGSCVPVAAPSSTATYVLTPNDTGQTIVVNVAETNGGGTGVAASAVTGVIAGNVPVNTSLPTISGSSFIGSTLTGTKGSWTGKGPIAYAYQWLLCDSGGGNCAPIAGATSTTITVLNTYGGHSLRFQVTASNIDSTGVVAQSDPPVSIGS